MANERGRHGAYGGECRGDRENEGLGYVDRSGPVVPGGEQEYGRYRGNYSQQRGEPYYGGRNATVCRPKDEGRSYGDWLEGSAGETRGYPSQQRGDVYGGYGQQGGDRGDHGRYGSGTAGGYGQGGSAYRQGRTGRGYEGDLYRGGPRDYYGGGTHGSWNRAGNETSSWFGDDEIERRRRMDGRMNRQHRGRGPRGYTRSDQRIREDVNDHLTDDWTLDASDIEVEVSSCEVTLSGEGASRSDKRRAEDIAEDISGVTNVQNNLRVRRNDEEISGTIADGSNDRKRRVLARRRMHITF